MGEVNIYGLYVPILLIQAILAYGLLKLTDVFTHRWVTNGWIMWPSIFHLCWYLVLLLCIHWLFLYFSA